MPKFNVFIIKSVFCNFPNFYKNSKYMYITLANHNINNICTLPLRTITSSFNNPSGPEIMQKLFSFLLAYLLQKYNLLIIKSVFYNFPKFHKNPNIFVNTLALRTIISSFNTPPPPPPLDQEYCKNYFHSYLTYLRPKCNPFIIN